jgi:hypothetical protein
VELQDTVAVPEPVTELGVIAPQVNPVGTVSVRATAAEKPPWAVIVIVEVADCPTVTEVGELAATVKSWATVNVKVALAEWLSVVLVAVTDNPKVPALVALQETVAVPDPVTLFGVIAPQVNPAGGVSVRDTTPVKPFCAVIVIVDVAEAPVETAAGEEAAMVKSWTAYETVAWCERDPLVPVTVTVYAPAEPLHDSVEVPDPPVILPADSEHVRPVAGETVAARLTVPVKPLSGATVSVDVPVAPATAVTLVGLAVKEKSAAGAVTVTVRVALFLERAPDVALMIAWYVFAAVGPLNVAVEVRLCPAVRVTELGLYEIASGGVVTGIIVPLERATDPAKPFKLAIVTVAVPVEPAAKVMVVGLTVMLKSLTTTLNVTTPESVSGLPNVSVVAYVPVTVAE